MKICIVFLVEFEHGNEQNESKDGHDQPNQTTNQVIRHDNVIEGSWIQKTEPH